MGLCASLVTRFLSVFVLGPGGQNIEKNIEREHRAEAQKIFPESVALFMFFTSTASYSAR